MLYNGVSNDNYVNDNDHHDVKYNNYNIKDNDNDNIDSNDIDDRDDNDKNVNDDDLTMSAEISLHISMERV